MIGIAAGMALVIAAWAWLVEPRWLQVERVPVRWTGPPLRVVLLADIHARPTDEAWIRAIVEAVAREKPELIVITGDFVDGLDAQEGKLAALAPLADLHARLGVYAVLGNHDAEADIGDPSRRTAIIERLRELRIGLLENQHVLLSNDVALVGLGSWRAGQTYPAEAFAKADPKRPTIVMMHNFQSLRVPWIKPFDIAVAGHTHAGQMCIPFTSVCPALEADMKPYRHGLYEWPRGGQLYVTAGLGESRIHARLGARPELTVLELAPPPESPSESESSPPPPSPPPSPPPPPPPPPSPPPR